MLELPEWLELLGAELELESKELDEPLELELESKELDELKLLDESLDKQQHSIKAGRDIDYSG